MDSPNLSQVSNRRWNELTHKHIIYYCQIVAVYIIALTCLLNLSLFNDKDCVWSTLLSASIGYLLPPPKLRRVKNESFLPNTT